MTMAATDLDDIVRLRGTGVGAFGPYNWAGTGACGGWATPIERAGERNSDCLGDKIGMVALNQSFARTDKSVIDGNNNICDKLTDNATRSSDQIYALSRDVDNKFAATTAQIHGVELEGAKKESRDVERFCRLEAGQATIIAKLDHNKEVQELQTKLAAAEQMNKWYCCPPPVRVVDPCCPS